MKTAEESNGADRSYVARTRLHVETPLVEGSVIDLARERAHYLRNVLRMQPGATLAVFNERDGEWQAVIECFGKEGCRLRLEAQRRAGPRGETDLWLLFAPIKRAGLEWMVEKATELGVSRMIPVITRRSDPVRINAERLGAIAIEAAEQCERLTVPVIEPPRSFGTVLAEWRAERTLLACCEVGPVRPIVAAISAAPPGPAAILIGPAGGFDTSELDELARHPLVVPVGLGPRVLRAETAALAALACWQALRGEGAAELRPPFRA
ncbi:MAG: 16S rRNA (uracil(1498)-N(3))-methyltransferase [Rhodospirillaceae bacterium]